jgi:hypothetical protein
MKKMIVLVSLVVLASGCDDLKDQRLKVKLDPKVTIFQINAKEKKLKLQVVAERTRKVKELRAQEKVEKQEALKPFEAGLICKGACEDRMEAIEAKYDQLCLQVVDRADDRLDKIEAVHDAEVRAWQERK